ncbi:MAG: hypothetical protein STSR0008_01990 [Ignavibacterium sp.]
MKKYILFSFFTLLILLIFSPSINSQTFEGQWFCEYATYDDATNGTGYNTPSVGVIKENTFVALVRRGENQTCFLIGYINADSALGRINTYGYGSSAVAGVRKLWASGFDQIEMFEAVDIAATPDSLIYVANNDIERNILVFKLLPDSIDSTPYRMVSTADSLWAIDVDNNGYVYVSEAGGEEKPGRILVFKGINDEPAWADLHDAQPIQALTIPDNGSIRGLAVNGDGTVIYASNYTNNKIYCYIGSPTTGYSQYTSFNFTYTDTLFIRDANQNPIDTLYPGPVGLGFMNDKNILFVACDVMFTTSSYPYGRIYALNPNTGEYLDTIDAAAWNYLYTGQYDDRLDDNGNVIGNVSGYTSPYYVDFDENYNVYTQSYYGWTVDKWLFQGEIPTIPLTIVDVEEESNLNPSDFKLYQNYPNPFNPKTTISYNLPYAANVTLKVYDILGKEVITLVNEYQTAGYHTSVFSSEGLSSGLYFYELLTSNGNNSFREVKKMTILK